MKELSSGAEATIFVEKDKVIKKRFEKTYRIPQIDNNLRKYRTRREAKVIFKLQDVINVPKLYYVNEKNLCDDSDMTITMEYIKGSKLRDVLNTKTYGKYCKTLACHISKMHNNDIIHGDLTTSNFIISSLDSKIYVIDFGLSFFSQKIEDKAVDLHLFRQALESKHPKIWEKAFDIFIDEYITYTDKSKEIMKRFKIVEERGRYKHK